MDNNIDIKKQILKRIKAYQTIIILRHIRPDGDCIGSSMGLRDILRTSFPDKNVYSLGDDNDDYLALYNKEDDTVSEAEYTNALVIVVDTATSNRISNKYYKNAKEIIKIDHHIPVDDYGVINYVRTDYPSCSTVITDFYDTFKDELRMTKVGAEALYMGTVTDTGRFMYRGVDRRTLELAGLLIDFGIDIFNIYTNLYIKDFKILKLEGYINKTFKTTTNGVSYMYINKRIQNRFNVTKEDAANLVNMLNNIRGSLIWINFVEQDDKSIRVRLRSRYIAINEFAEKYGGGGHANACGAVVYNKKQINQIIKEADNLLKEFKSVNREVF